MQIVESFDDRFGGRLKHALSNGLAFACILVSQVLIFNPKGGQGFSYPIPWAVPKFCSTLHVCLASSCPIRPLQNISHYPHLKEIKV
jgi:hypothetical protein